jgi:hypothetical protein
MLRRDSRQRAAVASALRADHRSWREVARALGYRSVGAAQAAVKAHLDREYRQPHEQTVWEQIEAVKLRQRVLGDQLATATLEGDVDRVVMLNKELARNGDQLAKLTGTYAPDRRQVDVAVDTAPSAATAEWLRQVAAAAAAAAVSGGGQPAAPRQRGRGHRRRGGQQGKAGTRRPITHAPPRHSRAHFKATPSMTTRNHPSTD